MDTHPTRTTTRTPVQTAALVVGGVFLLVGALGFLLSRRTVADRV